METAIIAALISAAATLSVCLINNHSQNKKVQAKHEETIALINYKLDEHAKKLDKHNNFVERVYKIEGQLVEVHHDIKELKSYHRPQ